LIPTATVLASKIKQFDAALRDRHAEFHASLRPGVSPAFSIPGSVREWFAWRDGQSPDTETLFLDTYRLVPLEEARSQPRSARSTLFSSPAQAVAVVIFARRMLYSWPLLVDGAGEGYFFSTLSRRVFYRFQGERVRVFPSFEAYLDFLIKLAAGKPSALGRIERELELIDEYAQ
jgi:hypothetical protein